MMLEARTLVISMKLIAAPVRVDAARRDRGGFRARTRVAFNGFPIRSDKSEGLPYVYTQLIARLVRLCEIPIHESMDKRATRPACVISRSCSVPPNLTRCKTTGRPRPVRVSRAKAKTTGAVTRKRLTIGWITVPAHATRGSSSFEILKTPPLSLAAQKPALSTGYRRAPINKGDYPCTESR